MLTFRHNILLICLLALVTLHSKTAALSRGNRQPGQKSRGGHALLKGNSLGKAGSVPVENEYTLSPVVQPSTAPPSNTATFPPSISPVVALSPSKPPSVAPVSTPPVDEEQTPTPTSSPSISVTAPVSIANTVDPPSLEPILNPTEGPTISGVEAEEARSRDLLPFSLKVSGEFRVDDVEQVIETFLFVELGKVFSTLQWILLTVTSDDFPRRILREETYDFTGVAIFVDAESRPSQLELERAQLDALKNFALLLEYVRLQGFEWTIEAILLDGIEITEDKIKIGDVEIDNDANNLEEEPSAVSDKTNLGVLLALLVVLLVLILTVLTIRYLIRRRRADKTMAYIPELETCEGLVNPEVPEEEMLVQDDTHEAASNAGGSSITDMDGEELETDSGLALDWSSVFALSQQSKDDGFEQAISKRHAQPPQESKHREMVLLSPVHERAEKEQQDNHLHSDGDSYGYSSVDDQTSKQNLGYNQGQDLTVDLADFISMSDASSEGRR